MATYDIPSRPLRLWLSKWQYGTWHWCGYHGNQHCIWHIFTWISHSKVFQTLRFAYVYVFQVCNCVIGSHNSRALSTCITHANPGSIATVVTCQILIGLYQDTYSMTHLDKYNPLISMSIEVWNMDRLCQNSEWYTYMSYTIVTTMTLSFHVTIWHLSVMWLPWQPVSNWHIFTRISHSEVFNTLWFAYI